MKKQVQRLAAGLAGLGFAAVSGACTQVAGLDGSYSLANQLCTSAADCPSGDCTGTPASPGWCTEVCSADGDCPDGFCASNPVKGHICFPACSDDAECTAYGVTCEMTTTIDGVATSICAGSSS